MKNHLPNKRGTTKCMSAYFPGGKIRHIHMALWAIKKTEWQQMELK
ncbi:hypothetical protein [Tenacibaculum finnmarkense]